MTSEPVYATLRPSLCVVAQGAKIVMLGDQVLDYDAARMLVLVLDLPVAGQVTRASSREPFLGFRLDLDTERVAELAARVFPNGIPKSSETGAAYVGMTDDAIIDAVARLVDLMAQPDDAQLLGPVVVDEILIRLLRSPVGHRVAQLGQPSSAFQVYHTTNMRNHHGGVVLVDGYLYGFSDLILTCLEFATGNLMWRDADGI
jgi:AraC-type transcriptional regulator N-terminus